MKNTSAAAVPEILFLTSYPPRECGIATYSQDLLKALDNTLGGTFSCRVCAFEAENTGLQYPDEVKYVLNTASVEAYKELSGLINKDPDIRFIVVQHEFGFFQGVRDEVLLQFLNSLNHPLILVFHTVLPNPEPAWTQKVQHIARAASSVVAMTKSAAKILREDYHITPEKVAVIAHGTHLVPHLNKVFLKDKYGLSGRKILSTFGLLSSGKSIETTLDALPEIIAINPDVLFLIIGKTHPGVLKSEAEQYREMLQAKVITLHLENHVVFINRFLPLTDLLEYLQLTDIYLFTSKDKNQAVSGTFAYAMSCGCPIVSTPIPHARELLRSDTGILFDFQDAAQLAVAVNRLMSDESLRIAFSTNTLQRVAPTSWENSAIAHALLLQKIGKKNEPITLHYSLPEISLNHLRKMTTDFGIIQFSKINQPDLDTGYTLDDNARALITICQHYQLTGDETDIHYGRLYLNFIRYCQLPDGNFFNYLDSERHFTQQNQETDLSDANGRAIWALGFLMSNDQQWPADMLATANHMLQKAMSHVETMHSTRAMAFAIKGLYYSSRKNQHPEQLTLITKLANRLVQMYRHEAEPDWQWFEAYLTYGNSILPEALLCAYRATSNPVYKDIAQKSFDFLLSQTFEEHRIRIISNKTWLHKGKTAAEHGEQPIDVAYTILALNAFYEVFKKDSYHQKMTTAFNWFLGNNHLHQMMYNSCTGGCYDGLEETQVNLNQGAESTVSYLMARMSLEQPASIKNSPDSSFALLPDACNTKVIAPLLF
ncbi:MAG TPA: glycosyltransferase [Saprospiraceae bacterium]|nr:glycosyltransferase [Saprospiraceae bacterium]